MATCYTVVAYPYGQAVPVGDNVVIDITQLPWVVDVKVTKWVGITPTPVPFVGVQLYIDNVLTDLESTGFTGTATFRVTDFVSGNHTIRFSALNLECSDPVACATVPYFEKCEPPTETILAAVIEHTCTDGQEVCIDGFIWHCLGGEWVKTTETCGLPTECTEGAEECRDGIIWRCVDGVWTSIGESCEEPTPVCEEGEQQCSDESIWLCYNGAWIDTNIPCTEPPECLAGASECRDGYIWNCVDGVMVNTGVLCTPVCVSGATECGTDGKEYLCVEGQWVSTGLPCEEESGSTLPTELLIAGGIGVAAIIAFIVLKGLRK